MRLASSSACEAPLAKLRDYLLNQAHADVGPKARFFASFGYTTSNITSFATALTAHALDNDVVQRTGSRFGAKYVVDCNLETPDARDPCIVTIWIQENGAPARLVTAYPR